ncbi:uncharacterized protein LOC127861262 [Dreissena polymorpha]|uniref:VWFA domain-containing protein n=1 Tax=Dreissena polymorpha TaxID=45954 RepID=A0A9D3YHC3_DREPO|nr:uncharacterized protein LOC127861262 [Dreissena polymorpha]KAH3699295.1 hypothetical protein DPMN_074251 [Dreissena polymorpha]
MFTQGAFIFFAVCACASVLAQTPKPVCNDISTSACQLMAASRPDLCSDPAISLSACPRFCKLCPLECYHCNATVLDFHECNTTKQCMSGEACMLKELKSFVDGHHEYEMTCAPSEHCDGGSGLSIAFGRRELESRDLTVSCCSTDHCNYPAGVATTPIVTVGTVTGCPKDIVFLVDEGSRDLHSHHNDILLGLATVVSSIPVGVSQNQVALVAYSNQVSPKFDLDDHTNQASLLQSLQSSNILIGRTVASDASVAIEYLVHTALSPSHGDRSQFSNTVVIITDSDSGQGTRVTVQDHAVLASQSNNVLVVSVGRPLGLNNPVETLGDTVVHISGSTNLSSDLAAKILAFLKRC